MALHEGEARLGTAGYPPEGGLFDSLLGSTCLYGETDDGWRFVVPTIENGDPRNFAHAWAAATVHLYEHSHKAIPIEEVYEIWRQPPFGIRDGLLPVLAVAFIQSLKQEVALYREGVFQPYITELDVQYLSNDPSAVQFRWINLSEVSRQLLSYMAEIVQDMDAENMLSHSEPIDVARSLVSIYDKLPSWVGRTQRISQNAKNVRRLFKHAADPNRFIFDDIPQLFSNNQNGIEDVRGAADAVRAGLNELSVAYQEMLDRLRRSLLSALGVLNATPPSLAEFRSRARNIEQVSGDLRMEAFVLRISRFTGSDSDMESLASMAISKPPSQWVDSDIDRSTVEIAELSRNFNRLEAFAHVKGRHDHRSALAVFVGQEGSPIHGEFEITDRQRPDVNKLVEQIHDILSQSGVDERSIVLGALANVTADYLRAGITSEESKSREVVP